MTQPLVAGQPVSTRNVVGVRFDEALAGTGVRLYLSERWNMSVRLDVQHETQPAPGRRKTDATSMIAIGAKF